MFLLLFSTYVVEILSSALLFLDSSAILNLKNALSEVSNNARFEILYNLCCIFFRVDVFSP